MDIRKTTTTAEQISQANDDEICWARGMTRPIGERFSQGFSFIYTLEEPDSAVVRYVGQTENVNDRLLTHLRESHNKAVRRWIADLRTRGTLPRYRIVQVVQRDQANRTERSLIQKYQRNGCLLNITSGPSFSRGIRTGHRKELRASIPTVASCEPELSQLTEKFNLTLDEAALLSGLPRAFLERAVKAGELKAKKIGQWYIRREDLAAF